jgi:transcriptional regulator GlxA family with amidase domain
MACHDRRVERVLDAITADLAKRVSRCAAARIANLEPIYFSKRFRRVTGVSFADWNASVRVEAAQQLLARLDLPISRIADALGYSAVSTLERVFRKRVGLCPREYRRRLRGDASERHETLERRHETPP